MKENNIEEQADLIIDLFDLPTGLMSREINECAQISVGIVINVLRQQIIDLSSGLGNPLPIVSKRIDYWKSIKKEIKNKKR